LTAEYILIISVGKDFSLCLKYHFTHFLRFHQPQKPFHISLLFHPQVNPTNSSQSDTLQVKSPFLVKQTD